MVIRKQYSFNKYLLIVVKNYCFQNIIIYISFTKFSDLKNSIIDSKLQSTSGYFLPVIITLFSTLAFAAILVVIFGVIIRRRKESRKKRRPKDENEFKFDDGLEKYDEIIYENEENSYEIINYYVINQNKSKIESNTSQTLEYLEIFEYK
jgi:hypothetical protein